MPLAFSLKGADQMQGIEHNTAFSDRIHGIMETTYTDSVLPAAGAASFLAPDLTGIEDPVIVTASSGVGPKLRLAGVLGHHEAAGRDCAALCINDIVCTGAKPLFFTAYIASGQYDDDRLEQIVGGISDVCRKARCAFLGSSRMEKDGIYADGKYDLAGFAVGICDRKKIIDGHKIQQGDILIGLASSGLHNEGYRLVHQVFELNASNLRRHMPELSCSFGEELVKPTAMYAGPVLYLTQTLGLNIKGMVHITEGGIMGNVPTMLPDGIRACITPGTFPIPAIFDLISQKGNIPIEKMFSIYNMGAGLIMAVDQKDAGTVFHALIEVGERPYMAGYCVNGEKGVELAWQR